MVGDVGGAAVGGADHVVRGAGRGGGAAVAAHTLEAVSDGVGDVGDGAVQRARQEIVVAGRGGCCVVASGKNVR